MKKLFWILSPFLILACSSVSEEQEFSAAETAKLLASEKWYCENIEKDGKKTIILTFENLKGLKPGYPMENIFSISAYTFLKGLKPEEFSDFEDIKIVINANNAGPLEKTYPISTLKSASEHLKTVEKITSQIISGKLDQLEANFDPGFIPDSTVSNIKNAILEIEAGYGRPIASTLLGFEFNTVSGSNEPVFLSYTSLSNSKGYSVYKLIQRSSDKRIIYFGLNEN